MKRVINSFRFFANILHGSFRYFPGIAIAGINLWIDKPRNWKLRVDPTFAERRARERREMEERVGGFPRSRMNKYLIGPPHPPLKIIHLNYWSHQYKQWVAGGSIAIDLNTGRLYWHFTDPALLSKEHKGSGLIGVGLFSLPFTLPLSPILRLVNSAYKIREKRWGMSRHAHALHQALKGQLDSETETLLIEALKKESRPHTLQKGNEGDPIFFQARELLCGLKMTEKRHEDEETGEKEFEYWWVNEAGQRMASGYTKGDRCFVEVRGQWGFSDQAAIALTRCYANRRIITREGSREE